MISCKHDAFRIPPLEHDELRRGTKINLLQSLVETGGEIRSIRMVGGAGAIDFSGALTKILAPKGCTKNIKSITSLQCKRLATRDLNPTQVFLDILIKASNKKNTFFLGEGWVGMGGSTIDVYDIPHQLKEPRNFHQQKRPHLNSYHPKN